MSVLWYPRWDSNPYWKDFKSSVSTVGLRGHSPQNYQSEELVLLTTLQGRPRNKVLLGFTYQRVGDRAPPLIVWLRLPFKHNRSYTTFAGYSLGISTKNFL